MSRWTLPCLLPLALLAAIYTSEFLDPRLKSKFKPAIELMASLPTPGNLKSWARY